MQIAAQLRSALPTVTDPTDRFWATYAVLWAFTPDTIASDTDAALVAARAIGAPHAVAYVLKGAAVGCLLTDPPNLDRFFAHLDEAIRLNESVGTSPYWEWMLLTWGRTLTADHVALDTLKRAVLLTYDQRHWATLDGTLEAAPRLLARNDPVAAATIYGYLEQSPPPWGQLGTTLRTIATELVNAIPDNETQRARGAETDRHDIVNLTLAAIDKI
jgi:hypothetical protein